MIILGIDPGLANTGWGVVEVDQRGIRPVSFGVVKTSPKEELCDRLFTIAEDIASVAAKYRAEVCSMEDIFFSKNVSSAVPVAKVIGAATVRLMQMGIPVHYFSPLQIKMAVTGTGSADKHQIQELVRIILRLREIPRPDHAADALADCITWYHFNQGWEKGVR